MNKKLSIFVFVLLLIPVVLQAQDKQFVPKGNYAVDNQEVVHNSSGFSIASANYVLVDSMANAFGPAICVLNPLAYDPFANVVAFVHRGHSSYAAGSGQLWYNYSTDEGTTWSRVGPINSDPISARYPSMAISNPTEGTTLDATLGLFSWPELNPTTFGNLGFGADQPVGAGTAFADTVVDNYSSQVPCWASDNSSWVFWGTDNATDASYEIFRTEDFGTITSTKIPSSVFADGSNISIGGVAFEGIQYLAMLATFPDPDPGNPIQFGWYPGFFTSTDNGETWDGGQVVDFRTIPALSAYDQLLDYDAAAGTIRFDGDINVDRDGMIHLCLGVTDTNTTPWTNSLVDIFQTGTGWDATFISDLKGDPWTTYTTGPGLGQMGYSTYLAFDANREVMAAQWVDLGATEWCDVWFSYKHLDSTEWSEPMNLTESDQINNTQTHLAPRLWSDGAGNYKAFSFYGYVAGVTGPYSDTTLTTNVYIAPVDFSIIVGVSDDLTLNTFELQQNYPNPFNPSTLIKYSIAERGNVTLRVFDMLGREVSTLVNEVKEAGSYSMNFDASNLASGVYVYTINSGNFTSSRKMMLLK